MIDWCRTNGIVTAAFYVLGFPQDDWSSIAATIDYAIDIGSTVAQFKLLTPYPATPLWKQLAPRIYETDWEKFDGFTPTFEHPTLKPAELRFLLERGVQSLLHAAVLRDGLGARAREAGAVVHAPHGRPRRASPHARRDGDDVEGRDMLTAICRYGPRVLPDTRAHRPRVPGTRRADRGPRDPAIRARVCRTAGRADAVAASYGRVAFYYLLKALDLPPGGEVILPALTFWVVPEMVRVAGTDAGVCGRRSRGRSIWIRLHSSAR